MRFAREHPTLRVVAVASRWAEPRQVAEFVRDRLKGMDFSRLTLLLDRDGAVAQRTGLVTHPQFVVYGAGRRVVARSFELDKALAAIGRARLA